MVAILRFGAPVVLAAAAAAFAMPRFGGDDCCQKAGAVVKGDIGARVTKAIENWKALPERMKSLTADDASALNAAQAVTDRICPVCKEMPATLAFLQEAFHTDAAIKAKLLESCHATEAGDEAGECPYADGKNAASAKPQSAPSAKPQSALALELVSVAIASMKPAEDCCAVKKDAKDDCCAAGEAVAKKDDCCAAGAVAQKSDCCAGDALALAKGLTERASKLETTWATTIPAAFSAIPAADKADLDKALATHKKLNPRMAAMMETMGLLRELCAADGCCATTAAHGEMPENMKGMADLMSARAELQKKTLAILSAMGKVCGDTTSSCCAKETAAN